MEITQRRYSNYGGVLKIMIQIDNNIYLDRINEYVLFKKQKILDGDN